METLLTGKSPILVAKAYIIFYNFLQNVLSTGRVQEVNCTNERASTPLPNENDDFDAGDLNTQLAYDHGIYFTFDTM